MTPVRAKGFFITLEGPEGSGKSTHASRLAGYLRGKGRDVLLTREPGGTSIGDQIRSILNDHANAAMHPRAEILLFCASRAQLVNQLIRPHLARGGTVVCDRYADSTLAYQGYGRGLELNLLKAINGFATGSLVPDMTLLLDLPVETGLARRRRSDSDWNRLDAQEVEFHRRVRSGYAALVRRGGKRWIRIYADQAEERVWEQIRKAVCGRLGFDE
ncbi:MAG: dTMP kinase [Anaerolineales bacterium]|nr:dTMP kinase [Anaerolineales bacterium]